MAIFAENNMSSVCAKCPFNIHLIRLSTRTGYSQVLYKKYVSLRNKLLYVPTYSTCGMYRYKISVSPVGTFTVFGYKRALFQNNLSKLC